AGDKRQGSRRDIRHDLPLDPVEIGPARLPVIRVAHRLNHLVWPELRELERASADRMGAHLARWHMAGIDWRPSGCQQREQSRLRPLQVKSDLEIAPDCHLVEIAVPGFAWIDAQLLAAGAQQQVPGTLDVLSG